MGRQQDYQKRQIAAGCCRQCGKPRNPTRTVSSVTRCPHGVRDGQHPTSLLCGRCADLQRDSARAFMRNRREARHAV